MDASNGSQSVGETPNAEIKCFFDSAPPLKDASQIKIKLEAFIEKNQNGKGGRVVCVTSGGTTVPLEQRCVRYIDNFSSGHRGAASTEGTCQPYCRSLPDDPLLECFEVTNESNITVQPIHEKTVKRAIGENRGAVGALVETSLHDNFRTAKLSPPEDPSDAASSDRQPPDSNNPDPPPPLERRWT
ncbi:phosphopantothenate--cysteine ligase 2 [Phtheirospermum japonicum]|uniref:Phosphopantothenate--cysteine ligase 2 n=1 Tax=Phtheirospermum japonicum TaxID=374723 RepID=A0A830CAC0_9LAMI|nr:phosphopantothenate--cysteine ligase 2 [Phtheirospermum japonicum]